MRSANSTSHFTDFRRFRFVVLSALLLSLIAGISVQAQAPDQLSLADLLIGLRSKKLSLPEKNKILTEAVRERGITFALAPGIEKELVATGAQQDLVAAIREKSPAPPKPVATPTPAP